MTYMTKVHGDDSGDKLVVESGGILDIKTGGAVYANGSALSAIADLDQTISGTYGQAEVQAISDKLDVVLAALRSAGIVPSS